MINVVCHLSLAPGPGGIQRHATKRPAPATQPQLASHEGEINAGPPSKAAGNSTVGASSSGGFYLMHHPVHEGSPPGPATWVAGLRTKWKLQALAHIAGQKQQSFQSSASPSELASLHGFAGGTGAKLVLFPLSEPLLVIWGEPQRHREVQNSERTQHTRCAHTHVRARTHTHTHMCAHTHFSDTRETLSPGKSWLKWQHGWHRGAAVAGSTPRDRFPKGGWADGSSPLAQNPRS